ncbi:hypothetical protein, partial [Streptomyces sp. NPDC056785]|uniref:3'-5' exonuclease n=1 Tax=Streptomyces sp. NPDC056785 TaxID=3345944 RepID=UPI0036B61F56
DQEEHMPNPLPLAFVDVETTHLSAEIGEAWEVAAILREDPDPANDIEYVWQIRPDLAAADPEALAVGRFEERFRVPPGAAAAYVGYGHDPILPMTRAEAAEGITRVLSGTVLVGSNPGFDERFLRRLLGPGGAQWHYRPYDIVQLAAVKLGVPPLGPLPWSTHALSRAVGVEPPAPDVAHTALGDARWARDVHDAVMVKAQLPLTWEGRAQHAIGLYTQTAIALEDTKRDLRALQAAVRAMFDADDAPTHCHERAAIWGGGGTCAYCTAVIALQRAVDYPSQPVMTGNHHFGRAWAGHAIEDACPCTKAPCGLVAETSPECTEHSTTKSTRQSHPADACPGPATPVNSPS